MKTNLSREIAATAPACSEVSGETDTSLMMRLTARGRDGKACSLVSGSESAGELRALAFQLARNCPADCQDARCPFRVLHGMFYGSTKLLVDGMTRPALLSLFTLEHEIRQNATVLSPGSKT